MHPEHKNWIHPSLDSHFSKIKEQRKIEFVQAHVWMENIQTCLKVCLHGFWFQYYMKQLLFN